MATVEETYPWPRLRTVVTAVTNGLHSGHFIENTLEALCAALGASSAWSTFESKGTGPIHQARTSTFYAAAPAVVAEHVTRTLSEVQAKGRPLAGPIPYAPEGSFAALPLWSQPGRPRSSRRLLGALYLDFPGGRGTHSETLEFLESVAGFLGAVIAQQALVEKARESLRERKARLDPSQHLELDELLAPVSMKAIRNEVRAAIRSDASIMILGESGTGKTQLATAIAQESNRRPIVRATLGFSDDLNTITSELFGHERGAFSGAVSKRKGLVEYANKGTLILDEVLNLPPRAQQLLLDFTQFGTYRPLGFQGQEPKKAQVRLISVTNGDIGRAVADTRFRQDLYFRLATVPLTLPPLRNRRADVLEIALRYLERTDKSRNWTLDKRARTVLMGPHLEWAGNVRELEAVMERARNRALAESEDTNEIKTRHLDLPSPEAPVSEAPPDARATGETLPKEAINERWEQLAEQREQLEDLERKIIEDALIKYGGVVAKAARELSVSRTGLISRMATLDIDAGQVMQSARDE